MGSDPVYLRVLEICGCGSVRTCLLAEAAAIAIPAAAAVIAIERTHLSGGAPVETADIVVPADRYRLRYRFGRPAAGL